MVAFTNKMAASKHASREASNIGSATESMYGVVVRVVDGTLTDRLDQSRSWFVIFR